ncbi:ACP phosphodiesterase [Crenobacter sp. SG2303]|uniref:ACP phosphodiesterase n=1 Tax=Crenobacter oryzisoli TaxID=3056844 RepID=A0ABT7XIP7_9NEIS|nr:MULTISPECIES: ACP phosphodiesterase [unclassified Crenobacter]MDN0073652.1 ACP phosphodiesterase [Crenobacter sp. SG2303]MDN0082979.1 ACP phosphodiesterase [Crenobacter sp. SG2305]
MNYLAHLHLAPDDAEARVGNLLGDFMKPANANHLPPGIVAGMALHRQIDRYTDAHPLFRSSKTHIATERRRYAGILVDIFYDHFLARHWEAFADQPLAEFTHQVYAELADRHAMLPLRLQDILPKMTADNWLLHYRELDGIASTLQGFSRNRLTRPNAVADGIDDLIAAYRELDAEFLAFYPQLQAAVVSFLAEQVSAPTSP